MNGEDWTPLKSGHLSASQYDPASGTLRIRFKGGETYEYLGVPASVHEALTSAASPGAHFHSAIRGQYPHRQI